MSVVQARVCSGCAPTVIVLDRVTSDSGTSAMDEDKMFALFSRFMATMSGNSMPGAGSTSAAPSESTPRESAGSSGTARMCVSDDIQTELADTIPTEMETQEQKESSSNSDTESEASHIGLKEQDTSGSDNAVEQDSVQASLKKPSSASNKSQPATVELYFAKKMNPEKKALRHLLRKASTEAKAYGTLTYKQLNPAQKKYIYDRVISELPHLRGCEHNVDVILAKSLIQAKHYRSKANRSTCISESGSMGIKSNAATKDLPYQRHSVKQKKKERKKKKMTSEPKSVYEKKIERNKKVVRLIQQAILTTPNDGSTTKLECSPGDGVVLMHNGLEVMRCTFVKVVDDMYAEFAFGNHLESSKGDPIDLPLPVESSGGKKYFVSELVENDIFRWKIEKIKKTRARKTVERYM